MTDKQIIIEDCPHFIGGCCQEYLDGVCENHKCDLKIIRELEQKLKAKEQECERLENENKRLVAELANPIFDSFEELDKLQQTLTEIKEIAETATKCMYATYSDDYTEGYRWLGSIILQKISEVEDG